MSTAGDILKNPRHPLPPRSSRCCTLSANINPFGIPDTACAAMHRAVDNCTQYPDPFCRAARQAIGAREKASIRIFSVLRQRCAGGCTRPIGGGAETARKVLLTAPTFAEYAAHALRRGDIGRTICGKTHVYLSPRSRSAFCMRFHRIWMRCISVVHKDPSDRANRPNRNFCGKSSERDTDGGEKLVVDVVLQPLPDRRRAAHTERPAGIQSRSDYPARVARKMYAVPGVRFGWCMTGRTRR